MKYSILITSTTTITSLLSNCLLAAHGFTLHHQKPSSSSSFVGQPFSHTATPRRGDASSSSLNLRMDLEEPLSKNILKRFSVPMPALKTPYLQIPKASSSPSSSTTTDTTASAEAVDELLEKHGMPWMSSIDPTYHPVEEDQGLFYMPFFTWQIQFMKDHLTDLQILPTESKTGNDLAYIEGNNNQGKGKQGSSNNNNVRMITLCFASREYRKIRMTVYDAGNRTQVFTSLFYPNPEYNLPVLGIDLLQFNRDRHLCVVDYQPISGAESNHAMPYEHLLEPIRNQYPTLQGKMTKRFYDENHFFSNQMLYSRFEELNNKTNNNNNNNKMEERVEQQQQQHPVYRDLFPAYKQYVHTHLQLIQSTKPNPDVADVKEVLQGQADYDTYSADRDPAHAMFEKVFGKQFADEFVYDVLFSLSQGETRST